MTSIENLLLQTHLNQTTITLNPTSIFQSLSLLPYTGLLGTLLTLTAHHLLLNFPVFQSFHLLKRQTSSDYFHTALDNHAPPSLRKAMTHNSSPWFESIVNDLFLSLNKGNISVLALLDFCSAFDTIYHPFLVHRVHTDFGFTNTVLQWFSSYLTDRTHYVSI